jgi:hypothetical protein
VANGDRGGNIQLIVVAVFVVVAAIGWLVMRQHDRTAIAAHDADQCWTATCRDTILQGGYERTTGQR